MPRTPGAKDKRKRRKAKRSTTPGKSTSAQKPPAKSGDAERVTTEAAASPAETGHAEFDQAVNAVLGTDSLSREGTAPFTGSTPGLEQSPSPPAAIDFTLDLGLDAWEALVQAPFRSLAISLRIPQFEQLGKLRAKMIAKPSYPLYLHYVTQWLTDNPDDELFVAKIMTGAVVATVLQEMWMIYVGVRSERAAAAAKSAEGVQP